ncbi:ATP-binding protein [Ruegeria sp. SCPT10]|uniref:ATP-binding protein n=1 Tax=Ruegeria sp. SCP10 TaxID=3141377 RepID=UPI003339D915
MTDLPGDPSDEIDAQIARLRNMFVSHQVFHDLKLVFDRHLRRRRAAIRMGSRSEARGLALIGASGSGKSTLADRLFDNHTDLILPTEGQDVAEVIRLLVPSPATLKNVGMTILSGLGYPLARDKSVGIIWTQVRQFLQLRRTLFVHLDEAQDLYISKGVKTRNDVVNTLKSLMNDKDWPVGLVLSGTPDLIEMINSDVQLKRRIDVVYLGAVSWISHEPEVTEIFTEFVEKSGLTHSNELQQREFLKRLVHAGGNEFGMIIEMCLSGIEEALYDGETQLRLGHFAEAFRRKSGCIPAFNPFLAQDYISIDVRTIMGWLDHGDPSLDGGLQ